MATAPWARPSGAAPWDRPADAGQPEATPAPASAPTLLQRIESNWHSNTDPLPSDGTFATAVHNIGGRAAQALVSPILHPIDTAKSMLNTGIVGDVTGNNPLVQRGQELKQEWQKDKPLALENLAGDAIGTSLGAGAGDALGSTSAPMLSRIGENMKGAGGRIIDETAGVLKKDVARGSQLGLSYLEGGGGSQLTMRGLGDKAQQINDATGQKLRKIYTDADANGVRIPADNVLDAVAEPVSKLRALQNGPGGTGESPTLAQYESQMLHPIGDAAAQGGFTPSGLFDTMKRPIAQNTRWNDPTMFDMNKVRQQTVGKIGGLLTDAVPESAPLNKIYQGTGRLAERASARADTGQTPLSQIGRRATELGLGAGLGYATHHPVLSALPIVMDTVPARTAMASGLYQGGNLLPKLARIGIPAGTPAAVAAGGVQRLNKVQPNGKSNK